MVPREKMAALELNTPPDKVLEAVRSGAHTRMPVYEGDLDNIVGIVNTKDLFYLFSLQGVVVLQDALYPALFLKPDETMANALRLFRKAHRPMALVRDDDGQHPRPDHAGRRAGRDRRRHRGRARPADAQAGRCALRRLASRRGEKRPTQSASIDAPGQKRAEPAASQFFSSRQNRTAPTVPTTADPRPRPAASAASLPSRAMPVPHSTAGSRR